MGKGKLAPADGHRTEVRALMNNAFVVNCDGVITIVKFLELSGPERDKRSSNSVVTG